MKLLQDRTKNGMFGYPTGNTFALVSSMRKFLDDEPHCNMITWNGSLSQFLKDMIVSVEISCLR